MSVIFNMDTSQYPTREEVNIVISTIKLIASDLITNVFNGNGEWDHFEVISSSTKNRKTLLDAITSMGITSEAIHSVYLRTILIKVKD